MARIRSIKPEFWTDGLMVKLPMHARLFYVGLWNFADDWGVLEDDPDTLKLRVMPADDIDAVETVELLVARGRLRRATAPDGSPVLVIHRWQEHQRIDKRSPGRWGNPDDFTYEPATSPRVPESPDESPAGRDGGEGMERRGRAADKPPPPFVDEFSAVWAHYPRKKARIAAMRCYQARRRAGVAADDLMRATVAFAAAMRREGRPDDKVMHGSTFYGPDERWKDYLDGASSPADGFDPDPLIAPWECPLGNPDCHKGNVVEADREYRCACNGQRVVAVRA